MLVDANVLLYAYQPRAAQHERARQWLEQALSASQLVRFAWVTLWGFIRIATNPRVFEQPLAAAEAEAIVSAWLAQPNVGILEPGERHWEILRTLMNEGQTTGPLVMDAVLAAIALEHGATLYSTDRDFSRFAGLKCVNPLLRPE
jgi:toxin-antitoxin system PIN domain toxin